MILKKFQVAVALLSTLLMTVCSPGSTTPVEPASADDLTSKTLTVWVNPDGADLVPKFAWNKKYWDEDRCSGVLQIDSLDYEESRDDCLHTATVISKSLVPGILDAMDFPEQWPEHCVEEVSSFVDRIEGLAAAREILPEDPGLYEIALTLVVNEAEQATCLR